MVKSHTYSQSACLRHAQHAIYLIKFDHIAPIPTDIPVLLLLDANIRKDTDSHGRVPIVLAWDPIVQLVNISTTAVHFPKSTNQAQGEMPASSYCILQCISTLSHHTWYKFLSLHDSFNPGSMEILLLENLSAGEKF